MDKPKKGNTITIKIDGKDRPFKEGKVEEHKNKQKKDPDSQECLLQDEGKQESAAAKEIEEDGDGESFEWILPEGIGKKGSIEIVTENGKAKDEKKQNVKTPKKPRIPAFFKKEGRSENPEKKKWLTTVIVTVFLAVLLGTILGFTMLNMVLPDEDAIGGAQPASQQQQQQQQQEEEIPVVSGGNSISLPALSTFVVQEGMYSSKETAQQKQTGLKEEGFPAVVMDMKGNGLDGKFALFVGVSDSLKSAKTLGSELGTAGIETFSKEYNIGEKTLKSLQSEEVKFLQLVPQMYSALVESAASKITSNNIQSGLKEKYQEQTKDLAAIDTNKLQNEKVAALYTEIEHAFEQLKIYDEKGDASTRNSLQQHMLSSLELYQSL